jgi:hypothetical protein
MPLGQALGLDLRFEAQTDEEARAEMSATTPAKYVDAFFDFYVGGRWMSRRCCPPCGRSPVGHHASGQWAAARADAFR